MAGAALSLQPVSPSANQGWHLESRASSSATCLVCVTLQFTVIDVVGGRSWHSLPVAGSHALSQCCTGSHSGATIEPPQNIKLDRFLRKSPPQRKLIMGHKRPKRKGAASGLHYPKEAVTDKNKVYIGYRTQNLLMPDTSQRASSPNRLAISTRMALRAISPQRTSFSRTRRRNPTSLSAPSRSPGRILRLSRVRINPPPSTSLSASSRPPSQKRSLCSLRMK